MKPKSLRELNKLQKRVNSKNIVRYPTLYPDNYLDVPLIQPRKKVEMHKKKGVDLHLSRKDAQYLSLMLTNPATRNLLFSIEYYTPSRKRILNKLKREGIK